MFVFSERFAAGEEPRWDQIKMLRDFLLLMAMLSGAPRSCVLTNMTGEEVANATNCSGKRVIKVREKLNSSKKKRKLPVCLKNVTSLVLFYLQLDVYL